MNRYEIEQEKTIREFVDKNKKPSKKELYDFFEWFFLHPDYEAEFTHKVAKNIIEVIYSYYRKLKDKNKYHFLKILKNLFEAILGLKTWENLFGRDDAAWFWKGTPLYFISFTKLIEPLEKIRQEMLIIDKKKIHYKIICVEGESEEAFLKILQAQNNFANLDFPIHNYKGKGNIQNLKHFVKEKNRQGIKVFVQYDKDGSSKPFQKKIKKACNIERMFGFKKDFEDSFPPFILKKALELYAKHFYPIKAFNLLKEDIIILLQNKIPFIQQVKQKYNISVNKKIFSEILARYLGRVLLFNWNKIFNEKDRKPFYKNEIFDFIRFVVKA